jgi:hypothetical protein
MRVLTDGEHSNPKRSNFALGVEGQDAATNPERQELDVWHRGALDPFELDVVAPTAVHSHFARERHGVELQRRSRITVLVLHHLQFREQRLEPFGPDMLAGELAAIVTERATPAFPWLTMERRVEELAHLGIAPRRRSSPAGRRAATMGLAHARCGPG